MTDLMADELRPAGGSWNGLLFENPAVGYPLTLTWTFTVQFTEIDRDYGSVSPALTIDWVPANRSRWDSLVGESFSGSSFADPIESSLYFFEHYRLDHVHLVVEDQTSGDLTVAVNAGGDIDELGLTEISARASLHFEGIYVQTDATGVDPGTATELLARFTSIERLRPRPRQHNVIFEPVP